MGDFLHILYVCLGTIMVLTVLSRSTTTDERRPNNFGAVGKRLHRRIPAEVLVTSLRSNRIPSRVTVMTATPIPFFAFCS